MCSGGDTESFLLGSAPRKISKNFTGKIGISDIAWSLVLIFQGSKYVFILIYFQY